MAKAKRKTKTKEKKVNSIQLLPASAQRAAVALHPDDTRYKCRFDIRSESSDSIYRISFDSSPGAGYWKCSCRGNIRHGKCKHLDAMGLKGRAHGRNAEWIKKLGLRGV